MDNKQKNKVIINVPPYLLGMIGIISGIGIATFTERSDIAALVIIFSIVAAAFLALILDNIFGE